MPQKNISFLQKKLVEDENHVIVADPKEHWKLYAEEANLMFQVSPVIEQSLENHDCRRCNRMDIQVSPVGFHKGSIF